MQRVGLGRWKSFQAKRYKKSNSQEGHSRAERWPVWSSIEGRKDYHVTKMERMLQEQ